MSIDVTLDYQSSPPAKLELLIYNDSQWSKIYKKGVSCVDSLNYAFAKSSVYWNVLSRWVMPTYYIQQAQPTFWYVAVANCDKFEGVQSEVYFKNTGGPWNVEFGLNERGLNTLYVFYALLFGGLLLIHLWGRKQLQHYHLVVKLLSTALSFEFASVCCMMVHSLLFMNNGTGLTAIRVLGNLNGVASRLTFILLLILLAKGWTITSEKFQGKRAIMLILGVFAVLYIIFFIWELTARDPATTLYAYDSVPGLLIVGLNIFTWMWYLKSIYDTYGREPDLTKKKLYRLIAVVASCWFCSLPFYVVLSILIQPWHMDIAVASVSLTVTMILYSTMVFIFWPSRAPDYFKITPTNVDMINEAGDALL